MFSKSNQKQIATFKHGGGVNLRQMIADMRSKHGATAKIRNGWTEFYV